MATPSLPTIWDSFPELNEPLQAVLTKMSNSWRIGFSEIDNAIRSQLNAGKLVRPALTLLFSELTAQPYNKKAIALGASVELLHLATLIHDDIIDESKLRRGFESIQSQFGKDTAVYAGDYLLTGMFSLLSEADDTGADKLALSALQDILFGELSQKQNRYQTNITFQSYISQISGKTAALFKLSVMFGISSDSVDDPNLKQIVPQIGETLGIVFQLLDDYLDFEVLSKNLALGKPIGQDIKNGIYTAPILFALEDSTIHNELISLLQLRDDISDTELKRVHTLVDSSAAMSRLNSLLVKYNEELNLLIDQLPQQNIKTQIEQLSDILLNRQY
ncbi:MULTISPECIES: polyprenyl synthetase family protein [Leuconostoc]|uniref:Polyprenyl synthetase family protein n=1 Tax=Leuconostoc pseudomesenteroides TaxID=33968 RepID=A0A5B8SXT4_LEUPS|nr:MULTISPECIES: polyprenyl synthetase family protein [Leuconostoc]MCC8440136.1 geranylgeranyl pyrophosphate synthase [Leuconostoc pseudomesenteroides]MDG9732543.1 polyprenyl synthetase family protein [Leuconostoc pseudomesenteroides]MDN2449953.1 polyprenyl synthetase family protein [Leuconostoc sp. UCMA20149]NKZ36952.1 polyprenyl synthetase family protein [Leuconostoc pseudomesenteroides]QEA41271.1 polyprenyl synthetase family protein [Leuconostoc pseudomesenteroides]